MAISEQSEAQRPPPQTEAQQAVAAHSPPAEPPPPPAETSPNEPAPHPDAPAVAHDATNADALALSTLEHQLSLIHAQVALIQQQLSEAAGNSSQETEEARGTLSSLRAVASEVQTTLTEVRTGKKHLSSAALTQLSGRITGVLSEAEQESAELGAATEATHTQTARRASAQATANARPTIVARISAAIRGRNAVDEARANRAAAHGNDEDDNEPEFKSQMDRRDRRNHDGTVSGREAVGGVVGVVRAVGSRRKRATAGRVAGEVFGAMADDDRRDMLDGSLHAGRGAARVTGSEDVGHAVTTVVGTGVTKANTAGNLISQGRVGDLGGAALRNVEGAYTTVADATGFSAVTNWMGIRSITRSDIQPFVGALTAGGWGRFVNGRNEKQFDIDGNGRIDAGEIMTVLRNNNISFDRLDADDDGRIEQNELLAQLRAIARRNNARLEPAPAPAAPAQPSRGQQLINTALRRFDTNHDGRVSLSEQQVALRGAGVTHAQADRDHNGTLSFAELANLPARPAPARRRNHD